MDSFKKALVAASAVATFSAVAYTALQGANDILRQRAAAFAAEREASIEVVLDGAVKKK